MTSILTGATLGHDQVDIVVTDGTITAIVPSGTAETGTAEILDLAGYLLLAAPAEPHSHFDKVLTAEFLHNEQGDLESAVRSWYGYRSTAQHQEIAERAERAARWMLERGTTAIRTHVDVGESVGLRFVHALGQVRDRLAGQLELEVVAFVDVPVTGQDGRRNRELLVESLQAGADAVGGAPYRDPDPPGCQRLLLELAAEHGAAVDLHTDEVLDAAVSSLTQLAELTSALGLQRVAASHCVSLSLLAPRDRATIADALAAAGVAVVCSPATNLYLQGRPAAQLALRGITPLRQLLAAGVLVAGGGDNIQDPFNPLGAGDALETAALLVLAGHLSIDQAYRAVSVDARRVLGLPSSEIAVGNSAELVAVRAADLRQAIAVRSHDRLVWHRGRLVAGTPAADLQTFRS